MSSQTSGPLARGCCARAGALAATAAPPAAAARMAPRVVLSPCCMVMLLSRACGRIVDDDRLVAQARFRPPHRDASVTGSRGWGQLKQFKEIGSQTYLRAAIGRQRDFGQWQ